MMKWNRKSAGSILFLMAHGFIEMVWLVLFLDFKKEVPLGRYLTVPNSTTSIWFKLLFFQSEYMCPQKKNN